jgi:hypothetical protein
MTPTFAVGIHSVLIGLAAFWQRGRVAALNRRWNSRLGAPGAASSALGTPKNFGRGALLMIAAGIAILAYSVVSGV